MGSHGYDEHARERWVEEPPKASVRTPFERDRARVVHSSSLRRLAAKTQVVGPQSDDFVRNRLTHSLEVAQVARDLGRALGCDPDVVETAALAHDLGHPPFGHNGEIALDDLAAPCGGFEGNAQTLRLLTRLEAKTVDTEGRSAGLNLTRASLDASTKYPWPRADAAGTKFGVYDDDLTVFSWMRLGVPARARCLEAQVMDFADDVAYSVHDLEDGVVAGRIDLGLLEDPGQRRDVWTTVRDWYLPDVTDEECDEALARLAELSTWPHAAYTADRAAQAALKNLTSELIGRFCSAVEQATRAAQGRRPLTRYAADLVVPDAARPEVVVLKGVAAHYVMRAQDRVAVYERQRDLIAALVRRLAETAPDTLDAPFRTDFLAAADDAARLRVLVDQVASLTDASAQAWHTRLC
jgi:dGTPase